LCERWSRSLVVWGLLGLIGEERVVMKDGVSGGEGGSWLGVGVGR
jgi:hypothetical protein